MWLLFQALVVRETEGAKVLPSTKDSVTHANTVKCVVTRTRIVIGVLSNVEPISFYDYKSKNYIGHDIDLVKESCKCAERECGFKPILISEIEKDLV